MGQVLLVFLVIDHIREPGSEVRVNKGAILQLEFEASIKSDDQR